MIVQLLLGGLVLISSVNGKSIRWFQSGTDFGQDPVCGYESCNKLNPDAAYHIHLVPHSHDDVGWLKTVDQVSFGEMLFCYQNCSDPLREKNGLVIKKNLEVASCD